MLWGSKTLTQFFHNDKNICVCVEAHFSLRKCLFCPGPDAPEVNNYPALPILALKVLPSTKLLSATQKQTAGHPTFPQFSSLLLILIRVLCL